MRVTIVFSIFILLYFAGCTSKTLLEGSDDLKRHEKKTEGLHSGIYPNIHFKYRIAPHDRIQITAFNHPELSTASTEGMNSPSGILVDGDGNIYLALVGTVHVSGLTQPSAAKKVQALYGKYLKKPSIHLEVLNKRAFVAGEVKSAGAVKLPNEQLSLLQAITSAGGFTDGADKSRIIVLRQSKKGTRVEMIDLTGATSLAQISTMIRPNDIVFVTASKLKGVALGIAPIFKLISDALLPFIRYQDLTQ